MRAMRNGQDAAKLPRRKRGRPPGSRKTTSTPEQRGSERREEPLVATSVAGEQTWSPGGVAFPSLSTNEVNDELFAYETAEENLTSFSNFLRTVLRRDRAEITRVAREMDVAENTIYRWMNGNSEPRAMHLKKLPDVLPEYRSNLSLVINQTFPGVLDMQIAGIREVRKDVYRRVLDLVALTDEEDTRFW